ncbi:MAG: hypothetical protein GEV03_18940 [Streptosporangiales bacterium]|nr:hypothetical protein [Streptosporangiales bacterium]
MGAGGFFRIECDQMHDLVARLDRIEDQLRETTEAMRACSAEALGSEGLDLAVGGPLNIGLADRAGNKIDELGESVEAILDRLRACISLYEQVDQSWAGVFGGSGQSGPGTSAGDGGIGGALNPGTRGNG